MGTHHRERDHLPMAKNADAPAVDLDRMSAQQLTSLIAAAEAKRREKLEDAKSALRAEIEQRAAELEHRPRRFVFGGGAAGAGGAGGGEKWETRAQAARRHRRQAGDQIPRSEQRKLVRAGPDAQLAGGAGGGGPRTR